MPNERDEFGQQKAFLGHIETLDAEQLGSQLGRGGQHVVREYGKDNVVKLPLWAVGKDLWSWYIAPMISPDHDTIARDVDICRTHFRDFVVETGVHRHNVQTKAYALLQPKMALRNYVRNDHKDKSLREQLVDILRINAEIRNKLGKWLDVQGFLWDFLWTDPYLANVAVTTDARKESVLRLHDLSLFPAPSMSIRGIQSWLMLTVQRWQLGRFERGLTM